jgi:TRAP-type mannitol/chloroaromatic compound transport system permease small subunit
MGGLLAISRGIDSITTFIGRYVAWAILAAILVSTVNAIVRKAFNVSSNSWLELQWILFGAVFMICSAWTLNNNEHIRIDIVSNLLPKSVRTAIEFIGHIFFLLPMAAVMVWLTGPYFIQSMLSNEQSTNAGGLVVWPGKFIIFFGFLLLLLQSFSEIIKRIAITRGLIEDVHAAGGHQAAAEAEAARLLKLAEEVAARETATKAGTAPSIFQTPPKP